MDRNKLFAAILLMSAAVMFPCGAASKKSKSSSSQSVAAETINYPRKFNDSVRQASPLLQKGDFSSAFNELKKDSFHSSQYESYKTKTIKGVSANAVSKAEIQLESAKQHYVEYEDLLSQAQETLNAFTNPAQKKNVEGTKEAYDAYAQMIVQLCEKRNLLAKDVEALKKIYEGLSEKNEISYPLLAYKFASGFLGSEGTGLLGVVNFHLNFCIVQARNLCASNVSDLTSKVSSQVTKSTLLAYPSPFTQFRQSLNEAREFADISKQVNELFSNVSGSVTPADFSQYKLYSKSMGFASNVTNGLGSLLDEAKSFSEQLNSCNTTQTPKNTVAALREGNQTFSSTLIKGANTISVIGKTAGTAKNYSWFTEYAGWADEQKHWNSLQEAYSLAANELVTQSTLNATKLWVRLANWYMEGGQTIVKESTANLELMKGKIDHPQVVLKELTPFTKTMQSDIQTLKKLDKSLDEGYAFRANFTTQRKEFNSSIQSLEALIKDCETLRGQATDCHNDALVARNLVNIYYNKAKSNFDTGNYSQAHTDFDRANEIYTDQLEELKKDLEVQEEVYGSLLGLREDFIAREKPILINEVRKYITDAKSFYYSGDFEQANSLLTRADTRRSEWAKLMDTEVEPNEELERLKQMVNTALSVMEGRIIYPEDPLYPEMSQILSIANAYFSKAVQAINTGDKASGKELLTKAKDKVNELKVVYPRNQEASILSLKIDQLLDKKAFDTMFSEKVTSLKKVNYARRDSQALDGYNDLLDLYEINPNYPGLKSLINSIEIDLGIRAKPVVAQDVSGAQELALEAKALLDSAGRNETLLAQAKSKANQALAINSGNSLAIQVLDEIALRSGGQAAVVLSAADEEKYQKAVKDLQNNNVFAAKQKVDELLSNPANSRSAKIIKLKKRIEALL